MILRWQQIHYISKSVILTKQLWDIVRAVTNMKYEYSKNHSNKHARIMTYA